MFKPVIWKTFPRDFIVIQIGFALFGLSITLMIRSNLGTMPWSCARGSFISSDEYPPGQNEYHRWDGCVVRLADFARRRSVGAHLPIFCSLDCGRICSCRISLLWKINY